MVFRVDEIGVFPKGEDGEEEEIHGCRKGCRSQEGSAGPRAVTIYDDNVVRFVRFDSTLEQRLAMIIWDRGGHNQWL